MHAKIMPVVVGVAMFSLTGCGDKSYSDPAAFVEKYVREEIEKLYPAKEYNELLQYKGFELVDAKCDSVALPEFGSLERVSCLFRVIPEEGARYYARYRFNNPFAHVKSGLVDKAKHIDPDKMKSIDDSLFRLLDNVPQLVIDRTDRFDEVNGRHVIEMYRHKNSDGVYVPQEVRRADAGRNRYSPEIDVSLVGWQRLLGTMFYSTNTVITPRVMTECGFLEKDSPEAVQAIMAWSNRCSMALAKVSEANLLLADIYDFKSGDKGQRYITECRAELEKGNVVKLQEELSELYKDSWVENPNGRRRGRSSPFAEFDSQLRAADKERKDIESSLGKLRRNKAVAESNLIRAQKAKPKGTRNIEQNRRGIEKYERQIAELDESIAKKEASLKEVAQKREQIEAAKTERRKYLEDKHPENLAKIQDVRNRLYEEKCKVESAIEEKFESHLRELSLPLDETIKELCTILDVQ